MIAFLSLVRLIAALLFITGGFLCFSVLWKGILFIGIGIFLWTLCGYFLKIEWSNVRARELKEQSDNFVVKNNSDNEIYEKGITADGYYDFTMMTKSEDQDVMEVLKNVKTRYSKELQSLGFALETASIVYKPSYILNQIVIELFGNVTEPYAQLATGLAYSRKGAYFRNEAIRYLQSYMDNYKPCPLDSYLLSEHYIVTTLADLYKKEYDYQKAYDCLSKYIDKGNIPEIREIDLLGDLLKKVDINKCVEYFERLLHSPFYNEETMYFINHSLEEAVKLQEKGYKYRPRKNHKKPFDEQMELDIKQQAIKYADIFRNSTLPKKWQCLNAMKKVNRCGATSSN